jgi:hypothetical protein
MIHHGCPVEEAMKVRDAQRDRNLDWLSRYLVERSEIPREVYAVK